MLRPLMHENSQRDREDRDRIWNAAKESIPRYRQDENHPINITNICTTIKAEFLAFSSFSRIPITDFTKQKERTIETSWERGRVR